MALGTSWLNRKAHLQLLLVIWQPPPLSHSHLLSLPLILSGLTRLPRTSDFSHCSLECSAPSTRLLSSWEIVKDCLSLRSFLTHLSYHLTASRLGYALLWVLTMSWPGFYSHYNTLLPCVFICWSFPQDGSLQVWGSSLIHGCSCTA